MYCSEIACLPNGEAVWSGLSKRAGLAHSLSPSTSILRLYQVLCTVLNMVGDIMVLFECEMSPTGSCV